MRTHALLAAALGLALSPACSRPPPPEPPPAPVAPAPAPEPEPEEEEAEEAAPEPEPAEEALPVLEEDRPIQGLLEYGGEGNSFRDCDGGAGIPLAPDSAALGEFVAAYLKLRVPPYEPVYVEGHGHREGVAGMPAEFRRLHLRQLTAIRVRAADDCPKLPPNPPRGEGLLPQARTD